MKNTARAKHINGTKRQSPQVKTPNVLYTETQSLSRNDKIKLFGAVNQLETTVVESNTFTKLVTEHFLNQAQHSLRIDVDKEHEDLCFGVAVLAETITARLKLATKAIGDITNIIARKDDAAHSKPEVAA